MFDNDEYKISNLVPKMVLNNTEKIPIIGLRTGSSRSVMDAIDIGYRHFDCDDQNSKAVGVGVNAKIAERVVERKDLFITTKIGNTFYCPKLVRGACETTLENLGLKYVDMYLMHCQDEGDGVLPSDTDGKIINSDVDYVDTWKEMEKLVDDGLAKSIGVSNFNEEQIERILAIARIQPATNQIECHPYINQNALMRFCKDRNIAITAYGPLGGSRSEEPTLMTHPKIEDIAKSCEKTPAQILIRYQLECGNIVIPRSNTKAHMALNMDVLWFELPFGDEMAIKSIGGGDQDEEGFFGI